MKAGAALFLLSAACGTIASSGHGDTNLPFVAGPYRPLSDAEELAVQISPYVLYDQNAMYREPSILPASSDPSSSAVVLYAVATAGMHDVIVRTHADDGRSFYGTSEDNENGPHTPTVVLQPDQAWEGAKLSGPSAVTVGSETWLYYAAAGGIGLAKSPDGTTFTKVNGPVFARDPSSSWEFTPPSGPSVAVFPSGTFHMLYASGDAIGEATSPDGAVWTRAGGNPVLAPSAPLANLDGGQLQPFDIGQVTDPCLAPRLEVSGRTLVRVLYAGYDQPSGVAVRNSAVGFAARYGESGPLVRGVGTVYSANLHEAAPALFEWSGGQLIYVHEDFYASALHPPDTATYPAIAAGFAPASQTLPAAAPFPMSP